ncbi:hypothetical protein [Halomicrobium sp. IBSBa]|uniref:hypothetical protein n=1 Tax=Halomicrobium sp. IBSBa TaxID=2778916 RepID=UPI001ABEFCBB|nr:hypothetical protein [Halomicrobium sp. IBSBa]
MGGEFVRASRLYDVEASEPLRFDWAKMQPLAESQTEVEQALHRLPDEDARAR